MSALYCGCDPEEHNYKCERHREMSELTDVGAGYEHNGGPNDLTLNEYQRSMQTYKDRHHECHALGLIGELAEVFSETVAVTIAAGNIADMVKKATAHGVALDREKLKKELGDVLWYIGAVASDNKLTLGDIAAANTAKLRERYPNGFVKGGGVRQDAPHNVVRQNPLLSDVAASVNLRTETEPALPITPSRPAYCVAFTCGCRETTEPDGTRKRTYCPNGECRRLR